MMQKVIGFTAGSFDMFHMGHLNLIRNAKSLCDYLIVGVNSDELIETYKFKRPVVPLAERMDIIQSIRYVDEIMRIDSLDKELSWRLKHYNLLFIGDDWKGTDRWVKTERVMAKHGVKVIYLPYTNGTTSTIIREKIQVY